MRYASVCDGIGAAHVAWKPLGWECAWTSEIEAFPAAVVEQRHGYRNLGDMTKLTEEQLDGCGPVSLLVGGTPCQSFSVAGLRKGLADPRGNLALRFVQLVGLLRPTWVVWENVPGVLSSAGGRDFGTFLGALAELGYGFAYRVLDAQWFGVAQRRRRVFVVAHARDWRRAAAVLFERESLFGDPPTRGEAGQDAAVAASLSTRTGRSDDRGDGQDNIVADQKASPWPAEVAPTLNAHFGKKQGLEDQHALGGGGLFVPQSFNWQGGSQQDQILGCDDVSPCLAHSSNAHHGHHQPKIAVAFKPSHYTRGKDGSPQEVTPPLSADADKGDQDTVVAFDTTQITSASNYSSPKPGDPCHPLAAGAHPPAVAFHENSRNELRTSDTAWAVTSGSGKPEQSYPAVMTPATYTLQQRGRDGEMSVEVRSDGTASCLRQPCGGRSGGDVVAYDILGTPATNAASETDVHTPLRSRTPGQSEASTTTVVMEGVDFQNCATTGDVSGTLMGEAQKKGGEAGHGVAVAFAQNQVGEVRTNTDVMGTVNTNQNASGRNTPMVMTPMAVRRLTPRECERLQGFPDDYTLVTYRNKPAADGPRYKALGNSMAVPVMAWIGRRIAEVEVLP